MAPSQPAPQGHKTNSGAPAPVASSTNEVAKEVANSNGALAPEQQPHEVMAPPRTEVVPVALSSKGGELASAAQEYREMLADDCGAQVKATAGAKVLYAFWRDDPTRLMQFVDQVGRGTSAQTMSAKQISEAVALASRRERFADSI